MDAEQRTKLIRDLAQAARDTASHAAHMSLLFRRLMESDDDGLGAADVLAADKAVEEALRALPELRRVFAKWARLLDGPPPRLAIRSTDEPERLAIIARYPSGDLEVGHAVRQGAGDDTHWRVRLTDPGSGSIRASIGFGGGGTGVDYLLEGVTRHMDEHGPWWGREESRSG